MSSRRNFILGVMNGVCYVTGMAFTSATVVLPWYVSQLTPSNLLIGILPALQMGGWALQMDSRVRGNDGFRLAVFMALTHSVALLACFTPQYSHGRRRSIRSHCDRLSMNG